VEKNLVNYLLFNYKAVWGQLKSGKQPKGNSLKGKSGIPLELFELAQHQRYHSKQILYPTRFHLPIFHCKEKSNKKTMSS